jgi:hypothetical protein
MIVPALIAAGCATMSVSSHVQRGLDITQYRSYEWGAADALPGGDPRLDGNPFFKGHLERAVEDQMKALGFERSTSGIPDLLIHYHASINQRIDVSRVDREYGYCYDEQCLTRVIEYETATLVLDLVDARTNRAIWRGWGRISVEDLLDNPDRMERQVTKAVARMVATLPRRPALTLASRAGEYR